MGIADLVKLNIDGIEIHVQPGMSILDAARANGIEIPTLCHDKRVEVYGSCGLCVVEAAGSSKLLRACSTKVSKGMVIHTRTPKVISSRKCALDLLLSDHTGDCKGPCSLACPAGTDCQGYVGLIANGEYKEAVKLIKQILPLPSCIGRVCPHPCETACRRQLVEEPVSIAALKSFVGDIELADENKYVPELLPDSGKKIAVIGGGPGGLTAAYFLRLKGHRVKVYDMMPKMGGMLRYGIPEFRLPKKIVDAEIEIIRALGIEFINNAKIGVDSSLDEIRAQNDAVVVAIGAWKSSKMKVAGEDLDGVIGGIDFLRETSLGNPPFIGNRVAVCGGGSTAMDACRTALRLGAKDVFIIYRRTREEMPAEDAEIQEAIEEGVVFKFLTNPDEVFGKNGKVTGMRLQNMELGEPDSSGRRKPVPVDGKFENIALDTVIMAIGQHGALEGFEKLERTKWATVAADETTYRSSLEGVFAIGDATNSGADIAIAAIGEGHRAAGVIDSWLNGKIMPYKKPYMVENEAAEEDFADRDKLPRAVIPCLLPDARKNNFQEINFVLSEEAARAEGFRCLECGCHDYFECKLIKYAREYDVTPAIYKGVKRQPHEESAHPYIEQNAEKCILCGLCVRVCDELMGVTAFGLVDRGFETVVSPEFRIPLAETKCISCGQCVALCPTGALREKTQGVKSVPVSEISTVTTCPGCAAGCQIDLRSIGSTLTRALPAGETGLLCVQGRFGYGKTLSTERILNPMLKQNGKYEDANLDETLSVFAAKINDIICRYGSNSIGVAVSEQYTSEEAFLVRKFAKKALQTENIFTFGINEKPVLTALGLDSSSVVYKKLFGDSFNKGANSYGFKKILGIGDASGIGGLKALVIFGDDMPGKLPAVEIIAVIGTGWSEAAENADVFLPASTFAETDGTFFNSPDKVLKVSKAVEPKTGVETWQLIQKLANAVDENTMDYESVEQITREIMKKRK